MRFVKARGTGVQIPAPPPIKATGSPVAFLLPGRGRTVCGQSGTGHGLGMTSHDSCRIVAECAVGLVWWRECRVLHRPGFSARTFGRGDVSGERGAGVAAVACWRAWR